MAAFRWSSMITSSASFALASPFTNTAPLASNSLTASSYTSLQTTIDCSLAQIIPLSNVFEMSTELMAIFRSAVSSIRTGVFPAPTPIAGFPDEYAARTIPGPPVARIRLIFGCRIRAADRAAEGVVTHVTMPSGAPAFTAASCTILHASAVHFFALGWGQKMMPLRVLSARRDLKIAVEVGLVVGVTPATSPTGSATLMNPKLRSSSTTPQVCVSL
mmetsp:Transcript_39773/g.78398  ORF Transcript_39773/g.78398 Transcript_39773/m.78398 type:complete len:217 (-) Transcript_39773:471-1121(-)